MQVFQSLNIKMTTILSKEEVLERLIANRAEHIKIYEEAVIGFKKHAQQQLDKALSRCSGTENVYLSLQAPRNYSSAYDTAIEMVRLNKREEIELNAQEFAMLMQDRWNWTNDFLSNSVNYSATANSKSIEIGMIND